MKVPFFAILMLVPAVALGQTPPDSGNDNATRLTPEQCRKNPAFPGCPAQPDMTATTSGDIPPGGWCDSVRPGCPTHPHIRTCDNCSAQAMQNKALLAATAEGDNFAYVVNRPTGRVRYYWVFVSFDYNGVHKSVLELATEGARPQAMKEALEAAAEVDTWVKSMNTLTEDELLGAGVSLPYGTAMELAADGSQGMTQFNIAIEEYMNGGLLAQSFLNRTIDVLSFFVTDLANTLANIAVDASAAIVFEWSDGSHVLVELSTATINQGTDSWILADMRRTTLFTPDGEVIPVTLAGLGIGGGEGTTDQYDVGDDPSGQTAFRRYLRRLAGRHCSVTTDCFEDSQGHYQCIGTVEC